MDVVTTIKVDQLCSKAFVGNPMGPPSLLQDSFLFLGTHSKEGKSIQRNIPEDGILQGIQKGKEKRSRQNDLKEMYCEAVDYIRLAYYSVTPQLMARTVAPVDAAIARQRHVTNSLRQRSVDYIN
jgi:hypothetical protein